MHSVHPLINQFEDSLVLIGFADVADDILTVRAVDSKHLSGFLLILKFLKDFGVNNLLKSRLPT